MIATFANGDSVEADFLIGADGIHSDVRAQFINDGEPVISRLHSLAWYFANDSESDYPSDRDRISRTWKTFRYWSSWVWDDWAGGRQQTQPTLMICLLCLPAGIGPCSN